MDEQLPPRPSIWDRYLGRGGRLQKTIFIALIVGSVWIFPPVLFFYIGYYIYQRRKGAL